MQKRAINRRHPTAIESLYFIQSYIHKYKVEDKIQNTIPTRRRSHQTINTACTIMLEPYQASLNAKAACILAFVRNSTSSSTCESKLATQRPHQLHVFINANLSSNSLYGKVVLLPCEFPSRAGGLKKVPVATRATEEAHRKLKIACLIKNT